MKTKVIMFLLSLCILILSSCAGNSSAVKSSLVSESKTSASNASSVFSKTDLSDAYSSSVSLQTGSNEWFMKEFINDLELVLGVKDFDSTKNLLEDELCLFAYMKLEKKEKIDKYYIKEQDRFAFPENKIDDIIKQYFGSINIHKTKYYIKNTKTYELGSQSFGSITYPEIAKKETLSDGRIKILVNNINPDLPAGKQIVIARTYIFKTEGSLIVLKSTKVEAYNPPEN